MAYPTDLVELCRLGKCYYDRGWMPATAGNLSVRSQTSNGFWITASGLDKGNLEPGDFLLVDIESGKVIESRNDQKPSAETSIHQTIYRQIPQAGAVLHVHNPDALRIRPGLSPEKPIVHWEVPATELVKALGFWEENPRLAMPVLYNHPKVEEIGRYLFQYFEKPAPQERRIPAILIENHGPSVWGRDLKEANRHLEAIEYILKVSAYYNNGYI